MLGKCSAGLEREQQAEHNHYNAGDSSLIPNTVWSPKNQPRMRSQTPPGVSTCSDTGRRKGSIMVAGSMEYFQAQNRQIKREREERMPEYVWIHM